MKHLVIIVLGTLHPNSVHELIKAISQPGCNIVDSRISTLGQEFAANFLVAGNWDAIAKLETSLPLLEKKLDIHLLQRRTDLPLAEPKFLPYSIYITALDNPGIIRKITQYLNNEKLSINGLYTSSYIAPHTQAPMITLTISISIPMANHIADLRERFMLFCDDHNLDVIMEPQKIN
ncbi:MAG: glycine cleavage system protein R [Gammaproteobacteria bacterium]